MRRLFLPLLFAFGLVLTVPGAATASAASSDHSTTVSHRGVGQTTTPLPAHRRAAPSVAGQSEPLVQQARPRVRPRSARKWGSRGSTMVSVLFILIWLCVVWWQFLRDRFRRSDTGPSKPESAE